MADDAIYWDVTMDPAVGQEAIREFGEGWLEFCPNFGCFVEKLVVQGDTVVSMGRYTATPVREWSAIPGMISKGADTSTLWYSQVAMVRDGKIAYVRDHWDSKAIDLVFE